MEELNKEWVRARMLKEAMTELSSEECPACGKKKKRRQSFCRACYWALPTELQDALRKHVQDGYVKAYREAKEWLLQGGW
jgi:hypothetical protein